MTAFPTVRVAAVQATPVILDAEASVAKAVGLLGDVAEAGAQLAVLPETFVSLYPSNAWAAAASGMDGSSGLDELWERMWASSVDVPGPLVDELIEACRRLGLVCAIGVNERESDRPGTLYNTLLVLGPGGLLSRHRKLMPTHHERLFHGIGAGDDLAVVETPAGRVGGLICWENRMPLARAAVYRGGPQIWVAPTADTSDGWQATMRHIAIESGAFVVSAPQFIPASAFPDDFPLPLPEGRNVFGRGGAVIVEPVGGRGDRRPALRRGGHRDRGLRPSCRPAREAAVRRCGALRPRGHVAAAARDRRSGGRSSDRRAALARAALWWLGRDNARAMGAGCPRRRRSARCVWRCGEGDAAATSNRDIRQPDPRCGAAA